MMRHEDIWRAIDSLARHHGYSPSGLARRAGLDPTTFNKSKRIAPDGRPRWPSTESIAKILEATNASMADFVAHFDTTSSSGGTGRRLPLIRFAAAASEGQFDAEGRPTGTNWDELSFPDITDPHAYALAVDGNGLVPIYRDGDILIVSPLANLRRGDRVVVKTTGGPILLHTLIRRGGRKLEVAGLAPGTAEAGIPIESVVFVHRIVWASQ
ncbi:MAG TPA: helix-turn-helix transcriptional regulator [Alphaproteobacteria bacterium]|nr:helix-turn-helix transcriptional regulator [Alphaproteobacteria bacterium]